MDIVEADGRSKGLEHAGRKRRKERWEEDGSRDREMIWERSRLRGRVIKLASPSHKIVYVLLFHGISCPQGDVWSLMRQEASSIPLSLPTQAASLPVPIPSVSLHMLTFSPFLLLLLVSLFPLRTCLRIIPKSMTHNPQIYSFMTPFLMSGFSFCRIKPIFPEMLVYSPSQHNSQCHQRVRFPCHPQLIPTFLRVM